MRASSSVTRALASVQVAVSSRMRRWWSASWSFRVADAANARKHRRGVLLLGFLIVYQ